MELHNFDHNINHGNVDQGLQSEFDSLQNIQDQHSLLNNQGMGIQNNPRVSEKMVGKQ